MTALADCNTRYPAGNPKTAVASPAMAESSTRNIENAVAACVAVVHSLGSQHFGSQYFDAYYNPADHKVYNNIQYVYQQQYLFLFNKCMVSHGFPLTE
jgi:hypothetical protein